MMVHVSVLQYHSLKSLIRLAVLGYHNVKKILKGTSNKSLTWIKETTIQNTINVQTNTCTKLRNKIKKI